MRILIKEVERVIIVTNSLKRTKIQTIVFACQVRDPTYRRTCVCLVIVVFHSCRFRTVIKGPDTTN